MALIGSGLLVVGIVSLASLLEANPPTFPERTVKNVPAKVDFLAPNLQMHDIHGKLASL